MSAQFGAGYVGAADESVDARKLRSLAFMGSDTSDSEEERYGDAAAMSRADKALEDIVASCETIKSCIETPDAADSWLESAAAFDLMAEHVIDSAEILRGKMPTETIDMVKCTLDLLVSSFEDIDGIERIARRRARDLKNAHAAIAEELNDSLALHERVTAQVAAAAAEYEAEMEFNEFINVSDSEIEDMDYELLAQYFNVDLGLAEPEEDEDVVFVLQKADAIADLVSSLTADRSVMKNVVDNTTAAAFMRRTEEALRQTIDPTAQLRIMMERVAVGLRVSDADISLAEDTIGATMALLRMAANLGAETVAQIERELAIEVTEGVRSDLTVERLVDSAVSTGVAAVNRLTVVNYGAGPAEKDAVRAVRLEGVLYALSTALPCISALLSAQRESNLMLGAELVNATQRASMLHWKLPAQRAAEIEHSVALAMELEGKMSAPTSSHDYTAANGSIRQVADDLVRPTTPVWMAIGLERDVDAGESVMAVMDRLAQTVYAAREAAGPVWRRVLLWHVFAMAHHGQYHRARDLLLGSRVQEDLTAAAAAGASSSKDASAADSDFVTGVALNRAVLMLGFAALANGDFAAASEYLSDTTNNPRSRELLGQVLAQRVRDADTISDDDASVTAALEAALLPPHRHITHDLVDAAGFIATAIAELPRAIAGSDREASAMGRASRRVLSHATRIRIHGCPDTARDHAALAAAAAFDGEWSTAAPHVASLRDFCDRLPVLHDGSEAVHARVESGLRTLALQSFLITRCWAFDAVPVELIAAEFGLADSRDLLGLLLVALARCNVPGRYDPASKAVVFKHLALCGPLGSVLPVIEADI